MPHSITLQIIAKPSSDLSKIKRKLDKRFKRRQKTKEVHDVNESQV
jgi:hypothetical protein